jgi:hypothetical protein
MGPCTGGRTLSQLVSADAVDEAPASGVITTWRVAGAEALKLRVLRPAGEEETELVAEGTSASATNLKGGPNSTSLPIRAGDFIGVDIPSGGGEMGTKEVGTDTAVQLEWAPALVDDAAVREPFEPEFSDELLLNADIVLAPVLSSLAPASGATAGGNAVSITGKYLDGATAVTFGSAPASSFSVDSLTQITAIAPASAAATVDVRVTGPGGASETTPADRYTFTAPATTSTSTGSGSSGSKVIPGVPAPAAVKLAISGFTQAASRWVRGGSLPRISAAGGRSPVGTVFSFNLNEAAAASLEFTERVPGRRVGGRCVARRPANSSKPSCKRTVSAGSLPLSAHPGPNKVSFQGRLSRARTLGPGTYDVVAAARDANGLRSTSQALSFTIAAR